MLLEEALNHHQAIRFSAKPCMSSNMKLKHLLPTFSVSKQFHQVPNVIYMK